MAFDFWLLWLFNVDGAKLNHEKAEVKCNRQAG
jgi:hypothetical protein